MDTAALWTVLTAGLRSAVSAVAQAWNLIPAEWRAPAVVVAGGGAVWGGLKFWRENRRLELSLVPGKYRGHVPPLSGEVYPFYLTITNRASSPNSIVSVRFFIDASERRATVIPLDLIGKPIAPYAFLSAEVVVRVEWLMEEQYRKVRFAVEPGRGRTRTFRFKAGSIISTY